MSLDGGLSSRIDCIKISPANACQIPSVSHQIDFSLLKISNPTDFALKWNYGMRTSHSGI
jgi:hypothetical protein